MTDLYQRSVEIILDAQAEKGAYPACQEFPTYSYCWFRDGAFIAHAMDHVGQHDSANRFHRWAASVIVDEADVVERAVTKAKDGARLEQRDFLHTRYAIDGRQSEADWPNFQLDGFGTWLWALGQHVAANGNLDPLQLQGAQLVAQYLAALWGMECYDCWEEHPTQIHPYTLASIVAGLAAHQVFAGADHEQVIWAISERISGAGTVNGAFVKSIGATDVDASLIGLATPYEVVSADHPTMTATIGLIESKLMNGGGIHRYSTDTYYGGGEWVLLTAWLSWHHRRLGNEDRAVQLLTWVEDQADERCWLPEQVPNSLNSPAFYPQWVERWGQIAKPLLWSHAMYLLAARPGAAETGS
jgi:GH15 family glucan-1,4-alpha-glucosidase